MKKLVLWIMALTLMLAACTAPQEEQYLPKLVPEEEFSEELYQALSADWAAYDALSWENQMASSHQRTRHARGALFRTGTASSSL